MGTSSRRTVHPALEWLQVQLGSWTWPGFQVMRLVREVAERFSLGVILGLRLLLPNLLLPLSFIICLMANSLSDMVLLASKERRRHSGWAYQASVLT